MSSTASPQVLFFPPSPPLPSSRSPAFLGTSQIRPCGAVESSSFERGAKCLPGVCVNSGMNKFSRFIASAASSTAASGVVPSDISDVLGEVTIFTAAGEPIMFRDLWDQTQVWERVPIDRGLVLMNAGIAVVALLRHFGCVCCWELASSLRDTKARFDAAGVKLIAVGVGTPDKAQILVERLPFPMNCLYADPTRKAYNVLGLYYGLGRTFFNPASTKVFSRFDGIQKSLKNYTINATPDDRSSVLQQGGMFVFKGKVVLYARKDEGTGDHASLDDVFEVCCKIPAP